MGKSISRIVKKWLFFIFCIFIFTGCGEVPETVQNGKTDEDSNKGFLMTGPGSYDSADTAVVMKIDKQESTITFYNLVVSKKYTLNFDGATAFYDKYDEALSLAQVREGDIVDITFLKSKKRLDTLRISAESWSNTSVSKYEINPLRQDVTIGSDVYKITKDTHIFSDGQEVTMMDLNSVDILTFYGIGTSIYSIVVEKGHGYLRLANDAGFVGGWIEVGQSVVRPISEDMLLTIPEGSYEILISHKGNRGIKSAVINRNEEVTVDIGDIEIAEIQYGQVLFAVTPSSARVYVDGEKVDISAPVTLEYGIHQMIAMAEGYSTITTYLRVGQASSGVEITMESESTEQDKEEEAADTTGSYKVFIDAPEQAEVYVNGNYVGISPISFKKTEGTHVITLRRTGYETRSYTIQVDKEEKDISYSFAELTAQ